MKQAAISCFLLFLLVLSSSHLQASANWPDLLNYQGQLVDAAAQAVPNGSYSVVFRLYTVPSGATLPFWSETQAVNARNGLFNAVLGSVVPLSTVLSANSNNDIWISVQVGADAEMTPRQQLLPSLYSTQARNALTLAGNPIGVSAFNVVQLDASGAIPAGLVRSSSLSIPLDLTGNGGAFNLSVSNTGATASSSAASFYQGGGGAAVNYGVLASASSSLGQAFHGVATNTNFYSDPAQRPLYGFYHNDINPFPAAIGVFSRSHCADCTAGYFYNTSGTTGAGAALYVNGRLTLAGATSSTFTTGNNVSSYTLTNSYIRNASNTTIILIPMSNIATSWWISSIGATTNKAVISFASPVFGAVFQYAIIGK